MQRAANALKSEGAEDCTELNGENERSPRPGKNQQKNASCSPVQQDAESVEWALRDSNLCRFFRETSYFPSKALQNPVQLMHGRTLG